MTLDAWPRQLLLAIGRRMRTAPVGILLRDRAVASVDHQVRASFDALLAAPGFGRVLRGEPLRSAIGAFLLDGPAPIDRGHHVIRLGRLCHASNVNTEHGHGFPSLVWSTTNATFSSIGHGDDADRGGGVATVGVVDCSEKCAAADRRQRAAACRHPESGPGAAPI